jgi:hypothetical protein
MSVRVSPPSSEQPRISSHSGEQPRIRQASNEQPRISSHSGEQPRIRQASNEQPRISSHSGEQPRIRSSSTEQPRISSHSGEQPRIRQASNEQPRISSHSGEQPRIRSSSTEQPRIRQASNEQPRISSQSSEQPRVVPPSRQGSSGQMGTLPLPRRERDGRPEGASSSPLEQVDGVGIYRGEKPQHSSPFIPQHPTVPPGSQGMFTPIPRPPSTTPPPRPSTGFGGLAPQGAGFGQPSAFSLPQEQAPRAYAPPIVEDEEPTQMAPLGLSEHGGASAGASASSVAPLQISSPFGGPPPEATRYPMIVEDEEPTQMSGFLFGNSPSPASTPAPSEAGDAPSVGMPEASWSTEPLASWRLEEGSDAQPWQHIHCHQPVVLLEVQVDRLYALLEGGLRVVSYRFPGGQPIAECTLPSVGTMLLATASGLAVLHANEAMFSLWDRSNLSGIAQVPVGQMPADMALLSRNQVLVANRGDGTLSLIDLQRGAEAERFHVGGAPCKILQHPRHLLILHQGYPQITLWPLTGPARN